MIRVVRPWNSLPMWVGPGPPGLSIYILVLLTRLFFNPHTAHSDVGGTYVFFSLFCTQISFKICKNLKYGRVHFYLQPKMGMQNSEFEEFDANLKTFAKKNKFLDFSTVT